jgi:excisionase family DNA binding protein
MSNLEKLMNETETAEILGVTKATLRKWRWDDSEKLPFVKIGRSVRYEPATVRKLIEQSRRNSTSHDFGEETS